jgi:hypothetical protein
MALTNLTEQTILLPLVKHQATGSVDWREGYADAA